MKKDITELFVIVDDFCNDYTKHKDKHQIGEIRLKTRTPRLSGSEIITILLLFHRSPAKNFKYFYTSYLQLYREEFPNLVSYTRFLELQKRYLMQVCIFLRLLCEMQVRQQTGIAYIDSTCIPVCHNKRTNRHKVFDGFAKLGKSSMGWFFGFKLHLIISEKGELLGASLTSGNVDDRKVVRTMTKALKGLIFGDKGYISKNLFDDLFARGLKLVTGIKSNMKNKLISIKEKLLLRKRSIIETVNSVIKKDFQISHTRHRSITNGIMHVFTTLIAYVLKSKKPSINWPF